MRALRHVRSDVRGAINLRADKNYTFNGRLKTHAGRGKSTVSFSAFTKTVLEEAMLRRRRSSFSSGSRSS